MRLICAVCNNFEYFQPGGGGAGPFFSSHAGSRGVGPSPGQRLWELRGGSSCAVAGMRNVITMPYAHMRTRACAAATRVCHLPGLTGRPGAKRAGIARRFNLAHRGPLNYINSCAPDGICAGGLRSSSTDV